MERKAGFPPPEDDPLWYKNAIIYELHVRAFYDSDGDGVGDFRGLIEKLDYLQDLGITAIWLLPFYPSPLKDDGYDISDFTDILPTYGKRQDFRTLVQEAHRRRLRVITELVANPQELYLPLIIDPEYHYEAVNVENQQNNPESLLWWMKRLILLEKAVYELGYELNNRPDWVKVPLQGILQLMESD